MRLEERVDCFFLNGFLPLLENTMSMFQHVCCFVGAPDLAAQTPIEITNCRRSVDKETSNRGDPVENWEKPTSLMGARFAPFTKNEMHSIRLAKFTVNQRVKLSAPILVNPPADPQRTRTTCKHSKKLSVLLLYVQKSLPISRQATQSPKATIA